jgi:hypothetical protein
MPAVVVNETLKQGFIRQLNDDEVVAVHHTVDFTDETITTSERAHLIEFPILVGGYLIVDAFFVEVETADGETATADFGLRSTTGNTFTGDNDGLYQALDLNAVGVYAGAVGTDAQMGVRLPLTTGAVLYMSPDHDIEDAKIHISVKYRVVSA